MSGTVLRRRRLFWGRISLGLCLWCGVAGPARADDWNVVRSEFDPRLVLDLKTQFLRNPEDQALFLRLVHLYGRHSSLQKLQTEFLDKALRSGLPNDLYAVARVARQRGQWDEAARFIEEAETKGLETAKAALLLAECAEKKKDLPAAQKQLARALAVLPRTDPRRKSALRRQTDLAIEQGDAALVERALREQKNLSQGVQAQRFLLELGEFLARQGKHTAALAAFAELANGQNGENKAATLLKKGELQETLRDELAAMATYQEAQKLVPTTHHLQREILEHQIGLARRREDLPAFIRQLENAHKEASRSFTVWELLGRLHDERGDATAAVAAFRGALRKDPHHLDTRRRLIAVLERGGLSPEVLAEYEKLVNEAPGDPRGYLELADRLWRVGQKGKALATLRRAAVRFQTDPSLHSALAEMYARFGEPELALQEAELLVRLEPKEESHIVNLGELYWARGKKERAEEVWRRLLNVGKSRAQGQAQLADVYAEHNLMPQALELYQKAVSAEPQNLQLQRGLALAYERLSRLRDAMVTWEKVYFAALGPAERLLQLEARKRLGALCAKESRLARQSFTWERRFAEQARQPALMPETVLLGLLLAEADEQAGKLKDAELVLNELLSRIKGGGSRAEVLLKLAPVLKALRKVDEAIAVLKEAADLLPDRRKELYAQLAELSMQSYRDTDAVRYAEQAVADAAGELVLGEILERRNETDRAIAAYKRAMDKDPRLFRAHMALGRLFTQRGELQRAAALYREVVRSSPQEEQVLEAGRRAVDLHEFLGSLQDLLKELSPLAYSAMPKPYHRRLLLLVYERYAVPLVVLSRLGDPKARAELARLSQTGLKTLLDTLNEGDNSERRMAVSLLGEMQNPSAASALLNVVGVPTGQSAPRPVQATGGSRAGNMDLRVDALLAVAALADPKNVSALEKLARSEERQLQTAALFGLIGLADKLDQATLGRLETYLLSSQDVTGRALVIFLFGRRAELLGQPLPLGVRNRLIAVLAKRRVRIDDGEELVQQAAVQALGRATADPTTTNLLLEVLRLGNDPVEAHAAWALGRLADPRAMSQLLRAVFQKRGEVRDAAVRALSLWDAKPRTIPQAGSLPRLKRGLDGPSVRLFFADLLVPMQTTRPSVGPAWLGVPSEFSAAVQEALTESPELALRTLEDLLFSEPGKRQPVRLGPLEALVSDENTAFRQSVAASILPAIRKLTVSQTDGRVQQAALRVLGQIARCGDDQVGLIAATALHDLLLQNLPPKVLHWTAEVYAQVPENRRVQEPTFDRLLQHPEAWLRHHIVRWAGVPSARSLLSKASLAQALQDEDGFVADAARLLK